MNMEPIVNYIINKDHTIAILDSSFCYVLHNNRIDYQLGQLLTFVDRFSAPVDITTIRRIAIAYDIILLVRGYEYTIERVTFQDTNGPLKLVNDKYGNCLSVELIEKIPFNDPTAPVENFNHHILYKGILIVFTDTGNVFGFYNGPITVNHYLFPVIMQ